MVTKSEKKNKYDIFIIILISSLVLGDLGGSLQLVRIITLIFLPFIIKAKYSNIWKQCGKVFLFWFSYALCSLLWSTDKNQGIKELIYFIPHMGSFFLIPYLASKAQKPLHAIMLGWLFYVLLASPFAFYEIFTDQHFGELSSRTRNYGGGLIDIKLYSALFYANYNTFVTYLCFALPFIYAYLLYVRKIKLQILGWIAIFITIFIILINASRGGILVLLTTTFIFTFYYKRVNFKNKKALVLVICIALLYVIYKEADIIFSQFINRFILAEKESSFTSDENRSNLFIIGIKLWADSLGFGIGTGSMMPGFAKYKADYLANHNLFIEILMLYGTIIFLLFLSFIWYIVKKTKQKVSYSVTQFILISALICLPIISIINAIYIVMPSTWIYFSSLLYISENYDNKYITK